MKGTSVLGVGNVVAVDDDSLWFENAVRRDGSGKRWVGHHGCGCEIVSPDIHQIGVCVSEMGFNGESKGEEGVRDPI